MVILLSFFIHTVITGFMTSSHQIGFDQASLHQVITMPPQKYCLKIFLFSREINKQTFKNFFLLFIFQQAYLLSPYK